VSIANERYRRFVSFSHDRRTTYANTVNGGVAICVSTESERRRVYFARRAGGGAEGSRRFRRLIVSGIRRDSYFRRGSQVSTSFTNRRRSLIISPVHLSVRVISARPPVKRFRNRRDFGYPVRLYTIVAQRDDIFLFAFTTYAERSVIRLSDDVRRTNGPN